MFWTAITYGSGLVSLLGLFATYRALRRPRNGSKVWSWVRGVGSGMVLMLSILGLTTAGVSFWYTHRVVPPPTSVRLFRGIHYDRVIRSQPRPQVIHVVKVDLKARGLRFLVTPDDPSSGRMLRARTTSAFVEEFGLQVAINANYFFPFVANGPWDYYPRPGDPVTLVGFAASGGKVYAPTRWLSSVLYLSETNEAGFDPPEGPVFHAIEGNGFLVRNGRTLAPFVDNDLYPRAVAALDRTANFLILIAVDGKQPNYSEGVTLAELADIVLEQGGHDAIRLDEGGSATLAARGPDGRAILLNCPINSRIPGYERPVANHLGIFAAP